MENLRESGSVVLCSLYVFDTLSEPRNLPLFVRKGPGFPDFWEKEWTTEAISGSLAGHQIIPRSVWPSKAAFSSQPIPGAFLVSLPCNAGYSSLTPSLSWERSFSGLGGDSRGNYYNGGNEDHTWPKVSHVIVATWSKRLRFYNYPGKVFVSSGATIEKNCNGFSSFVLNVSERNWGEEHNSTKLKRKGLICCLLQGLSQFSAILATNHLPKHTMPCFVLNSRSLWN